MNIAPTMAPSDVQKLVDSAISELHLALPKQFEEVVRETMIFMIMKDRERR